MLNLQHPVFCPCARPTHSCSLSHRNFPHSILCRLSLSLPIFCDLKCENFCFSFAFSTCDALRPFVIGCMFLLDLIKVVKIQPWPCYTFRLDEVMTAEGGGPSGFSEILVSYSHFLLLPYCALRRRRPRGLRGKRERKGNSRSARP